MRALTSAFEAARGGIASVVLVAGEPGIGKSRLADEFASVARDGGASVVWGRCWEAGGAPAYSPWVQALRTCVRRHPEAIGDISSAERARLAEIVPEIQAVARQPAISFGGDPEAARFELLEGVHALFRAAARSSPIVVVLDDLQVADAPSLLVLEYLARHLSDDRVVIVATYRDTEVTRGEALAGTLGELRRIPTTSSIELPGLNEPEIDRLVRLTAQIVPDAELITALHRETDGNPLYVDELVRLLTAEGRIAHALGSDQLALPAGLHEAIDRRVRALSEPSVRLLESAAILGREFGIDWLQRFVGQSGDEVLSLLGDALDARIVTQVPGSPGRLRFSHAVIRDVVYERLPPARRVELHAHAAESLLALHRADPEPHLAEIAHHFYLASPGTEVARAVEYGRRAAERAARLLAYEEAVRLYQLALEADERALDPNPSRRCQLLLGLGDAQTRAGDGAGGRETFLRAAAVARIARLPEHLASAAMAYGGRFVWAAARGDTNIVPLLEEALSGLPPGDSEARARVLARLGAAARDTPGRERALGASGDGLAMARRIGEPATLAYALIARFQVVWGPDEPLGDSLAMASEIIRLAQVLGDREMLVQGYHWRLFARLMAGDVAGAEADFASHAEATDELRQPTHAWYTGVIRAMWALFRGDFAKAEKLSTDAYRLGQASHSWTPLDSLTLQHFAVRREQRRLDEFVLRARRVLDRYETTPDRRAVVAYMHHAMGRMDDAQRLWDELSAGQFAEEHRDNEWFFGMACLVELCREFGDGNLATLLYRRLEPYRELNVVSAPAYSMGAVSRSLGKLAAIAERWDEAERDFRLALHLNVRMGALPWVAQTQLDLADLLMKRSSPGDGALAAALIAEALATCRALGMEATGQEAAQLRARLGQGTPAGRGKITPVPASVSQAPPDVGVLRLEGDYWSIRYGDDSFRLRDSKGLRYLARLLLSPNREIHALDLVADGHDAGAGPKLVGDAGEMLDDEAREAYRRRLVELEAEMRDAGVDAERAEQARIERDFLVRELARAFGLGGRSRRAGSAAERARVSVTRAIRSAMTRVAAESPSLGDHLERTIRTGAYCLYQPDPRAPLSWQS